MSRCFCRLEDLLLIVALASLSASCVPEIEDETSLVQSARVLAIRATPAEAREGNSLELSALVATLEDDDRPLSWSACRDRKPLTELGPVSPACLVAPEEEPELAPALGMGPSATLELGSDACTLFGPERPDPKPGEPAGRPVDPDLTGGFYQPILAWLGSEATLGAVRVACPLVGAARETTVLFNQRYRLNENPSIVSFERVLEDGSGAAFATFSPGERARLRVTVPSCPTEPLCGDGFCGAFEDRTSCASDCLTPAGCGGSETYAYYNATSQSVQDKREALVVTWYASAGRFRDERTEPIGGETMENDWTAPAQASTVRFWVVLRDDRGGVDWRSADAEVGD